jgi:propanediol utilization protein
MEAVNKLCAQLLERLFNDLLSDPNWLAQPGKMATASFVTV